MCHCSNLYHVYNNNYNNNYSFVIPICLQPVCKPHLYFILHTTEVFKQATSHMTDCITTDCRLLCLALLQSNKIIQTNVLKVEGSCFRLLENSIAFLLHVYVHSHTCLSLMLVIGGLFVSCSMYLLACICVICIVYRLPLVVFYPFILIIFVFVAFAYCFHVNDIRSFHVTICFTRIWFL